MPGFDGVETLKRIRELRNGMYQDLPVIALTANTVSGAREMFRNEGFTEFVPKPIERTVLERVLRRVLPKRFIQYGEGIGAKDEAESSAPAASDLGQKAALDSSPGLRGIRRLPKRFLSRKHLRTNRRFHMTGWPRPVSMWRWG